MSDQYPHEPVPEEAAVRPARTVGMIVSNAVMGVPVIMLGASLGKDYGFPSAAWVILIGCVVTAVMASLAAVAGVRSRRSTALLAEQTFGTSGAKLLNLAIAVALLGWLSVELGFIGQLLKSGAESGFGVSISSLPGIVAAGALILAITIFGIGVISRTPILFLPLLGLLLIWVGFHALRLPLPEVIRPSEVPIGTGVSAIVGGYIVGCLIMPDYSRFVRSASAAVGATSIALGIVYALVLATYALGGIVVESQDPAKILIALGIPAALTLILPIGLMQNGVMCLYSSSLAIATVFRRLTFSMVAIALMVVGLSLAIAGVENFFVQFLVTLGIVFPPATAVLIHSALSRDAGASVAWNWSALAVWGAASLCSWAVQETGFGLTAISALDGFIIASALAYTSTFIRNRHVLNTSA